MNALSYEFNTKRPGLFVIGSGLATSAISLFLVFLLAAVTEDFQLMGFYLNYIIPIGAIGAGLVAGSGYGFASWLSGVKISRKLLLAVVGLQIGTYFLAQYVEYRNFAPCYEDGTPLGFFEYYDYMARSFAWTQDDGSMGEPIGLWGYAFRLLEVAGFAIGGLIVPLILFKKPYCAKCQVYMKTRNICLIPNGVQPKRIKKKNVEEQAAYDANIEKAEKQGKEILSQLQSLAENGQTDEFNKLIKLLNEQKKTTGKLTSRISVALSFCNHCHNGFLQPSMLTGQSDKIVVAPLDQIKLENEFVRKITL